MRGDAISFDTSLCEGVQSSRDGVRETGDNKLSVSCNIPQESLPRLPFYAMVKTTPYRCIKHFTKLNYALCDYITCAITDKRSVKQNAAKGFEGGFIWLCECDFHSVEGFVLFCFLWRCILNQTFKSILLRNRLRYSTQTSEQSPNIISLVFLTKFRRRVGRRHVTA